MPSKTHALLTEMFRQARDSQPDGLPDLAEERRHQARYDSAYQPVPGVTDEPADELVPGSRLLTPQRPRDDLVVVFVHGGGFRTGSALQVRQVGARLALDTRARVLLPHYRLAPEHPYPAALEDCEAAYAHALGLAPKTRVVVGGESAGANLALALLLRRRDGSGPRPLAGFGYSGVYDLRPAHYTAGSWVGNAEADLIIQAGLGPAMTADYLAGHAPSDPHASPVTADLTGLPPLFLQVSGAERLRDDTLALVAAASRAGVQVELEVWPEMPHSWQIAAGFLPEATEALARTTAFINRIADGRFVDGAALLNGPTTFPGN